MIVPDGLLLLCWKVLTKETLLERLNPAVRYNFGTMNGNKQTEVALISFRGVEGVAVRIDLCSS